MTRPRASKDKGRARGAPYRRAGGVGVSACCRTASSTCRRSHGDATDNVPGAPGIGIKTAAQLMASMADLDHAAGARRRDQAAEAPARTLTNPEIVEKVRLSRRLVQLVEDAPLATPSPICCWSDRTRPGCSPS